MVRRMGRMRMRGRGKIMDFIRKGIGFLRKHKVVSRVANGLSGILPGQYGSVAGTVGKAAGAVGFGRRRRTRRRYGRGLRLAG